MDQEGHDYFYEEENDYLPKWGTGSDDAGYKTKGIAPETDVLEEYYNVGNNYRYRFRENDDNGFITQRPEDILTFEGIATPAPAPTPSTEITTSFLETTTANLRGGNSSDNLHNLNDTDYFRNASSCDSELLQASNSAYLYGIMFLMVVALLLNGLSIIIFRSKGLKRYAFSLYFVIIAVIDTLALISYVPRKWLPVFYVALGFEDQTSFYDTNTIACKALTYLAYVLRFLSSWLLVALGSERLQVATTPYKRSRYPTLRSAKHGFAYCAVAAIICNAHVLFIWDSVVVPGDISATCVPTSTSQILALGLTILTVVLIIGLPFVVVAGLLIMVVRNFRAWKLRPRRLSSSVIARALFEKDATVMVVSILGCYTFLCVPYIITWIVLLWQHFLDELPLCRYLDGAAARDVAEVGFMINFAIKFLLCIMFGNHVLSQK